MIEKSAVRTATQSTGRRWQYWTTATVGEGGPAHTDDILGGVLQVGWKEICKKGKTNTTPSTLPVQGSWIINLNHFASFVNDISIHLHSCKENVLFVGETYCSGLASILSAKSRGNIATE